jgi:hypothetical protein
LPAAAAAEPHPQKGRGMNVGPTTVIAVVVVALIIIILLLRTLRR